MSAILSPITDSGIGMIDVNYRVSDSSSLCFSGKVPMDRTSWDLNDIDINDIGEYGPIRVGNELAISLAYKIKY